MTRHRPTRVQLHNMVERDCTGWIGCEPLRRAERVLAFCEREQVAHMCSAEQLAAAMQEMPYWSQGPGSYLDMVHALTSAAGV